MNLKPPTAIASGQLEPHSVAPRSFDGVVGNVGTWNGMVAQKDQQRWLVQRIRIELGYQLLVRVAAKVFPLQVNFCRELSNLQPLRPESPRLSGFDNRIPIRKDREPKSHRGCQRHDVLDSGLANPTSD